MSRLTLVILIICSICILGGSFGNRAYADDKCVQRDSITATGDYLQETGEWHNPCGNKADLRYTFIINGSSAAMRFKLDGSTWQHEIGSWAYTPGPHSGGGTAEVNLTSSYRLIIQQYRPGPGFESPATFRVRYFNDIPE